MPSSYAGMNIEQLRLCAKEGDTEAQFLLGVRLLAVRGGAMEGTEHLKAAAKKRHLQACERLGSVYLYGEGGVPQDKKQATVYYEQAFALGSVTARTRLAELYLEDEEKAPRGLKLLTDMAQAGDKAAATRAARLFLSGEVSGVDFERAATYANLSEDSAVLYEAAEKLDTLGVNPELRDELYRKLMEKDREGARLSPSTLITMSRMYRLGKGVKQDGRSAERLLKRAVELEGQQAMTEPRAELALAELYETGAAGLPADHAAARGLLKSLYKEGSEVARVRYVRLCTADGRYLDAYCALAEAKQYHDALGYVLEHWDAIPDQAAFVQRAFLFAEAAQREQPGLRALRDELYRRQRLAGMPADQVLAFALKKGDAQGALTFFSALDDADKSLIYQNREVCASAPAARPDEPPACAQLRALLGEVPQEIRRWEELLLRLRACTSAPQRWEFAQAVLADLPAARAGEARQLTALRKALEQVRQPEETPAPAPEKEPAYAAMRSRLRALPEQSEERARYARECLAVLPPERAGEASALAELRQALLEASAEERPASPEEEDAYAAMRSHLRALPEQSEERARYARECLASLPPERAGEASSLAGLRQALLEASAEQRPAPLEEDDAYAVMRSRLRALPEQSEERARYARECLASLPPERAGEASSLAELRQAMLEASAEQRPAPSEEDDAYAAMRSRLRALPEQSEERARFARECLAVLPPERAGEASSLAELRQALLEASAEERPAPPEEEGRAYFAMLSRFRRLPRLGSARAQYAGETLSRLPERRKGEPEALTRLRQELAACLDAQQRAEDPTAVATPDRPEVDVDGLRAALEALDAEPAKALRCAIETLNGLPPQKEGEGQALTAFREELWEYLRQRWSAFASAFAKKSGDSAKAVRQAQSFASNFLAPAKPLYEGAPCKEFDAICAAVERILSRKEEERQARERKRTAWVRKAEAFQPDPQDVARLPAVTRALSALPARQEGEEEGLTAYRALLEQEQRDIATRLEAGLAACASTAERRRFAAENRDYVLFALPAGAPCGRQMQELRRKFAAAAAGRETIWEQRLEGVLKAPSDAARISLLSELAGELPAPLAGELPAPLAGEDPALTQLRTLCAGMEWKQRLEAFNLLTDEAKKSAFARGPLGVLPEKQKGEDSTLSILRSLLTPYQEGNDVKPQRADNVSQQEEGEWTPVPQEAAKPKKRGRARRALLAALIIAAIGACGLFAWQLFVAWRGAGAHDLVSPTQSAGQVQPTPFHANRLTQLQPVEAPSRYYIDRWTNTAYMGDFMALIGDEARQVSGIGWFVPSSSIDSKEEGAQGQVSAAYDLGGQYKKLTFLVSSDQVWTDGAQAGTYNLAVATDGETVYETGWCDHTTSLTDITVDLTGCQRLTFTLTQRRGSKGTLNIVMGELALE